MCITISWYVSRFIMLVWNYLICIESLFIETLKPFRYVIGMVYTPPNNSSLGDFLESLENIYIMELLSNFRSVSYIMGDYILTCWIIMIMLLITQT